MIQRYSRPEMAKIWTDENKFQKWLEIELAACEAHVDLGNIEPDAVKTIKEKASFSVPRIKEIEAEIHHDVIAFLTSVAESIGPESRFVHMGLTSSDVVDTGFSMLIQDAGLQLTKALEELQEAIKEQAFKHKDTLCMGRTHGVHAEPTTLGLKLTVWYDEMTRNAQRLKDAVEGLRVGKISGAVGNFVHMPPELEAKVCEKVGLKPAPSSTQTLQRDRHAQFVTTLAVIGGTLEKMATEIRALQKTEFNEVLEPFSDKQKGSSAMPHKKNPIICERVTGLSRVIRGYALTALENQALWHERDISHSGAERVILPDATTLIDYMFSLMTRVIKGMRVNEDAMKENIGKSYNVFLSQQLLLEMVKKGMVREEAYRIVQKNAHSAFDEKQLFNDKIAKDPKIQDLFTPEELDTIFDFNKYTKHVQTIFDRVYK